MMFSSLSKSYAPYEQLQISGRRKIRITKYGIETPSYLGPKLRDLAANESNYINYIKLN